jgi:Heterokaryon incompatibility protein (HET)
MLEISHYHSLDERFEAGPPADALCLKCRSLKFKDLFSGPRYEDIDDAYDNPVLDVVIGTVAESRSSAEECRLCYLISAFHDAYHTGPGAYEGDCKGFSELCILKPCRTDIALRIKDESKESDKESIATCIVLRFEGNPRMLRGRLLSDTLKGERPNVVGALTKEIFSTSIPEDEDHPGAESERIDQDQSGDKIDVARVDHSVYSVTSSDDYDIQGDCTSSKAIKEMAIPVIDLPKDAYAFHTFLFCLPIASSIDRRRTFSLSATAQGSIVDWRSLRRWTEVCEKDHLLCRSTAVDEAKDDELLLHCIDVTSSAIVPVNHETRYLALSYVWGTAHSELAGHIKSCIIGDNSTLMIESLPSTIRDAIWVTKLLGERYLWVDSLCLDQSDASALTRQIGFMDRIYEKAILTIVTSTSQNVYSKIPGLRPHSRLRSVSDLSVDRLPIKAICTTTVALEFEGVWSQRAWTFQEWILSKRCLFFSNNQILFRCKEFSGLESFQPPNNDPFSTSTAIPKFWADTRSAATILPTLSLDSPTWNFQTYADLVRGYTGRDLRYMSDIFLAFTGIMRKLERSNGMTFVEAMPAADLLRALLWSCDVPPTPARRNRERAIPSWTWAAWSCPAEYLCWDFDESSIGEALRTQRYIRFIESTSTSLHPKRLGIRQFKAAKRQKEPIILSITIGRGQTSKQQLHEAFRLKSAEVALLPHKKSLARNCLQVISETRSVSVHRNPPKKRRSLTFSRSEDDLLHPITKKVIAGRYFKDRENEYRRLFYFNISFGPAADDSFSSYDAVLLYEWDICVEQGRYQQEVVAMIIDRLADGTVERVLLMGVRSKDWYELPLVSEREELTVV